VIADVVITGVGCLLARAPSAAALRAAAPPRVARLPDALPRPAAWACTPPRLARMDRFSAVTFLAAHEAFVDADLGARAPRREAFGVCLGTAYGCHAVNEDYYRGLLRDGVRGASPRLFAATLPSSPVGEVAIGFGARGPALTLAEGWTAGLQAVAEAARLCHRGAADVVLAGGSDVLSATLVSLLADWGLALDAAEGAAFVVVERAAAARARGARPLAAVRGAGAAFGPTPAHGPALPAAMAAALRDAGLGAAAVARHVVARAPEPTPPAHPGDASRPARPAAGPPGVDPADRFGVTLGAAGALAVVLAVQDPPVAPTLVGAADPLGGAAALVLGPAD
jgi:3-oxoacyl-[acyl-carrier-protein] synthase II